MSTSSLTRKYRPQRFAEVAGQEAVKRILSRAAGEDKAAPAYLFSGTRGVGKTTVARIFAKALNCETAPTDEPCNECAQCRRITAQISPDVVEIDAATHGGVDEARRLKEDVGYAPLQSRYKVFIIDEAHMLSKAAFNALLKTLEEPPDRVTFILATTEPHKFPPTIISRCQHFIFKRMTQAELEAHLAYILDRENISFEPGAVGLIAKRGAGSVRDSMSLLGQALALGEETLTETDVRGVLGLAGQDVFFGLAAAIHDRDLPNVVDILRQVLDKGLDIGFFLSELAVVWRNMFILRQAGEAGLPLIDLSGEEAREWLAWAGKFDLAHIHACWQMTLEGRRRVMNSLEPALALELLLLNLAFLPQLFSLEDACRTARPNTGGGARPAPVRPQQANASSPAGQYGGPRTDAYGRRPAAAGPAVSGPGASGPRPQQPAPAPSRGPVQAPPQPAGPAPAPPPVSQQPLQAPADAPGPFAGEPGVEPPRVPAPAKGPRDWNGFTAYYQGLKKEGFKGIQGLDKVQGEFIESTGTLRIVSKYRFDVDKFGSPEVKPRLAKLAAEYFGPGTSLEIALAAGGATLRRGREDIKTYVKERPEVKRAVRELGAEVIDCKPRTNGASSEGQP